MAQHNFLSHLLKDFEENPRTQVRFHFTMMVFWMIMAVVGVLLIVLTQTLWVAIGVLLVYELSIYANWDTDYGAVSAAQANIHSEWLVQQAQQPPVEITIEQQEPSDG